MKPESFWKHLLCSILLLSKRTLLFCVCQEVLAKKMLLGEKKCNVKEFNLESFPFGWLLFLREIDKWRCTWDISVFFSKIERLSRKKMLKKPQENCKQTSFILMFCCHSSPLFFSLIYRAQTHDDYMNIRSPLDLDI